MFRSTSRRIALSASAFVALSFLSSQVSADETAPAAAQAQPVDDGRNSDREAIRRASQDFVRAFEQGDLKAIVAAWTEDGEYHGENGQTIRGRAAIEKAYAELLKTKGSVKLSVDVNSIRLLSKDSAIEEGILRETPAGAGLPISVNYRVFYVREDGAWKSAIVQEWSADLEKLDDVDWLVGDWTAKGKDHEVVMSFAWNDKKSMIKNRFTLKQNGKVVSSGTQSIVLDPTIGKIRSWMFDEEGGRGESIWNRDGGRWALDTVGVLPDGTETASINLLSRNGADEFVWRATDRVVGGAKMPDSEPVTLKRVKSANETAEPSAAK